jgi:hypothetical protein
MHAYISGRLVGCQWLVGSVWFGLPRPQAPHKKGKKEIFYGWKNIRTPQLHSFQKLMG